MTQKVYRLINASLSSGNGSTSKVKISSADDVENYLDLKIAVQDGLTKEITNSTANEVLTLGIDVSQIDHTLLSNIGTNSHAEIDSALNLITDVNWTGDYDNGTTYSVGDGVMYNGASFRMIAYIGAAGYAPPAYPGNWLQVTDYVSPNDIGLGNVDNTSDADKPISDDTQDALDLKVDKAGDTMTGPLNMSALSENIQFSVYGLNATQGIEIKSDNDATRPTGNITLKTGDASGSDAAGAIYIQGGSNVDGNPGNILLTAGQSSGTGSDGVIVLDAKGVVYLNDNAAGSIDAGSHTIQNVADPVSDQDAATKNWVEQASAQTNILYVDSTASIFGADGSLLKPFVTIADALAVASDGYVIEILPGTYNEIQVVIPSTLYSLTIKGQSQNSVIITNGFSYTSPASSIDILLQELNVGQLTLDASAALNGIVTLKQASVSLNRTDSNGNVFLTISESTIFGGTCYGAANASECLIIGNIDIYSFVFIFENCKFVSSVTAYGATLVRVLDSNLFGATEFLNGVTVGLDIPILQIDTVSDYFGSFTGTATKILLANIPVDKLTQSGATTNQAIVWDGTKWNPAFLVSNDPIDNNSSDIAPSQQAVLTKLNEYLRLQDGGTITGPVEIQNNKPNYFSPILALTSAGGSSNIFTITRNRSLGDSDSSTFTGVDLAYNSSESSNNGTIYFINANSNLPQLNDLVLFESTNNIQTLEGYICTIEAYYYMSNVTSGIWDIYTRYSINNHSGTLNGYDFQATIATMTSGSISGVNFTANIADKGAGDVDIFETNSNINFTSTGDNFNGVKITPIISGTPDNVTGVFVDMSNSVGANVKAISVVGESDFSGEVAVKDSNLVVNYTNTLTGVNSTATLGEGTYAIQTTQPDSSYVLIQGTDIGTAATQYDGVTSTPLMPTLPEHYTVKQYVDDQDDLKANVVHNHDLSAINESGAGTGEVPIWNGTAWEPGVPTGSSTWGAISGTLSDQTDLQEALDAKVAKAGDTMTGNLNFLPVVDESESTLSHTAALFIQKDAGDIVAEGSYTANGFVVTTYDPITSDVLTVSTLAEGKLELVDGNGDAILPVENYDVAVKEYVDTTINTNITTLSNELKIPQAIYVNNNPTATGYVATGSIQKPYQTIKAALDSIVDASAAKRYCIVIAPGTYNELNTIRLKGFVDLISIANDTVVINAGGSRLLWSNNSPGRVFITDISISHGVEVLNDNPTGTSGCVLDLDNVDTGTVIFNGRGGGRDFIQLRNDTRLSGSCTINSAATTIFDSTIIGNVNLTDTGCVAPDSFGSAITATLRSNYQLNVNITSTNFDVYVDAWGNNNVSTLTMTSNSAIPSTFNSDAVSYPNTITLSGSPAPVVARTTQARAVSVNPVSGIVSTDVQSALEELASEATNIYDILEDTNEPTGFVDRAESVISFNDSLRKFTIAPVTTNFSFYIQGTKYTKTSAEELVISNTDGNHYIYYDANGDLTSTTVFSSSIIEQFAFVAIVYWNSEINAHVYFAEERHGITMDGVSHSYLHTIFGARYLSGLALQGFTVDGAGTNDADAQFTSDSGSIRDEDILHILPAQTQIPVYYRQGQLWRRKAPNGFPFIYSGTAGYTGSAGRIPYNQYTGGAWQLTEVANNGFVLIHYFATNDIDDHVIAVQGTNTYGNVSAARLAAATEISSLSGLPFAEFVAIGSVVLESSNSYSNTPKAIVRSIDGGDYLDFRGTQLYTPAGEATTHGLLSGLANDDHPQYHTDSRANTWLSGKTTDDLAQGANNLYLDIPSLATPSALDAANDDLVIYSSLDTAHKKIKLNQLTSVVGSAGDIAETSASFLNNISTPTNVVGLAFATAVVSSFEAQVVVSRGTKKEVFTLLGVQIDGDFSMSVESVGVDTGIDFTITDLGQVQYTSTNAIDGGTIKFRAITLTV